MNANALKNPTFTNCSENVNRKSFCDDWKITFSGAPKENKYQIVRTGKGDDERLHLRLQSLKNWFRICQDLSPDPKTKALKFSVCHSSSESAGSFGSISQIVIMEVNDRGYHSVHTRIAKNIKISESKDTWNTTITCNEFRLDKSYVLAIQFNNPVDLNLWNTQLEYLEHPIDNQNSAIPGIDSNQKIDYKLLNILQSPDTNTDFIDPRGDTIGSNVLVANDGMIEEYSVKIERIDATTLVGWAVSLASKHKVFNIDIFIDDVYYDTIRNDVVRNDLEAHNLSEGLGGIRIEFPRFLFNRSDHFITLRMPNEQVSKPISVSTKPAISSETLHPAFTPIRDYENIAVIIPVYNAYDELAECLDLIGKYTHSDVQIIVVNDASTDVRIPALIKSQEGLLSLTIETNAENKGFTSTVNIGIEIAEKKDVILLNSDARVTPGWIESLQSAAYTRSDIATVTPLSDNSGAFSAPEIGKYNPLAQSVREADFAKLVRRNSDRILPSVPTGNGFCMYIKRACIHDVGTLDEEAFPRGYGEENDFCMRALRNGWSHVVDDSCYVFHERSASFGDSKAPLMTAGRSIVDERYPEYSKLTKQFTSESMKLARFRVRQVQTHCLTDPNVRTRILFVYSTKTGGTPQTNQDLMESLEDCIEPWTLRCDSKNIYLERYENGVHIPVKQHRLLEPVDPVTHLSREYDDILTHWMQTYNFELVHIRHIAWHSLNLVSIVKSFDIPVVFSFHDFYTLCPSVNLIDENAQYCGGQCTISKGDCQAPLWPANSLPTLKHGWIDNWRNMLRRTLSLCDLCITTSDSARRTIVKVYPDLKRKIKVIPHGRNLVPVHAKRTQPGLSSKIKILLPGNITQSKGLDIVDALLDIDGGRQLEFHILGKVDSSRQRPGLVLHGEYTRSDIAERVSLINPTVAGVFSIWDETYCHTLTEMWSVGLPVIVFDFGTVGTRVRESGAGWIYRHEDVQELYDNLTTDVRNLSDYTEKLNNVAAWQATHCIANTS